MNTHASLFVCVHI